MGRTYYTTSQAARLLAVSPDTVLKWVKARKIASYRTPGGHHRIPAEAVAALLPDAAAGAHRPDAGPDSEHCWEHYAAGETPRPACRDCDLFRRGCGPRPHVLVVSRHRRWVRGLRDQAAAADVLLEVAASEYACGAAVARFRPEVVVVDGAFGTRRTDEICRHLNGDPRIPGVRVVLASRAPRWPGECAREIGGWIRKPFTLQRLATFVAGAAHGGGRGGSVA